ncbi:MAG: ABC transporter substrate-binding protein [Emcibacteraceae bacterium]
MEYSHRPKIAAKAASIEEKIFLSRRMFIIFLAAMGILFLMGSNSKAQGDNSDPAELEKAKEFIEAFSDRAIGILNNKNLTEEQTFNEYRKILNDSFAIDYISRITLSRHRNKASKEELDEYSRLFPEFILKVNSSRLQKLDTTKLDIDQVVPNGKTDIFVRTKAFNADDKPLDVDWRVRSDKNGTYKIIDVKIEGISMVATQRDDFTSRISSSGISGLNKYMKDIIDGIAVAQDDATS